jgi:hypothetical protein
MWILFKKSLMQRNMVGSNLDNNSVVRLAETKEFINALNGSNLNEKKPKGLK